ncbi:hypothetical protein KKH27_04095 [bacterium]|nr:hypothetical protein [bacterium]MBU1983088.1 hypothetical protein [bacterium]
MNRELYTDSLKLTASCKKCHQSWHSVEELIDDPAVTLNGFQVFPFDLHQGLLLFTHRRKDCGSTFAVPVVMFRSLYDRMEYTELNLGKETCPGYCLDSANTDACDDHCSLHWVRVVMQIIMERKRALQYSAE